MSRDRAAGAALSLEWEPEREADDRRHLSQHPATPAKLGTEVDDAVDEEQRSQSQGLLGKSGTKTDGNDDQQIGDASMMLFVSGCQLGPGARLGPDRKDQARVLFITAGHERADDTSDRVEGTPFVDLLRRVQRVAQMIGAVLTEQLDEARLLVGEVLVEDALRNACGRCDVLDSGPGHAVFGGEGGCSVEQITSLAAKTLLVRDLAPGAP